MFFLHAAITAGEAGPEYSCWVKNPKIIGAVKVLHEDVHTMKRVEILAAMLQGWHWEQGEALAGVISLLLLLRLIWSRAAGWVVQRGGDVPCQASSTQSSSWTNPGQGGSRNQWLTFLEIGSFSFVLISRFSIFTPGSRLLFHLSPGSTTSPLPRWWTSPLLSQPWQKYWSTLWKGWVENSEEITLICVTCMV